MTGRFHFQMPQPLYRLSELELNARAALIAAPAIILTGLQYGWLGLLTGGLFLAAGSRKLNEPYYARLEKEMKDLVADLTKSSRPLSLDHRIQQLCDETAQKLGPNRLQVRLVDDDEIIAGVGGGTLFLSGGVVEILSESELEWLIAHEIEHSYQPATHEYPAMVSMAHTFNAVTVIASLTHSTGNGWGTAATLGAALASAAAVQFAHRHLSVAVELRCDKNALLVMDDIFAARSGLRTLSAKHNEGISPRRHAIKEFLRIPFDTHPTLGARLRNLDRTDREMHQGASARHAPAP